MSTACPCGTDVYSINPAEVVIHRADGPCTIEPAQNLTAGVNDGQGTFFPPDGADDAPNESKGDADYPPAPHPAPVVTHYCQGCDGSGCAYCEAGGA